MNISDWIIVIISSILIILMYVRMYNYDNKINVIIPTPGPQPLQT